MAQSITTAVNRITKDEDRAADRMRQLAEREAELQDYARAGYSLTHTAVIDTTDAATFVDTFTKHVED